MSFEAARTGIATVFLTFELQATNGLVEAGVRVKKNGTILPSAIRAYDTDFFVTANLHTSFEVSKEDEISIEVNATIMETGQILVVQSPVTTVLYNN